MTKDWNSLTKYWVVWRNVSKFFFYSYPGPSEWIWEVIYVRDNELWFFSSVYSTNDQQVQYIFLFFIIPHCESVGEFPYPHTYLKAPPWTPKLLKHAMHLLKGCLTSIHFTAHISLSLIWISPIYFSVVCSIPQKYIILRVNWISFKTP